MSLYDNIPEGVVVPHVEVVLIPGGKWEVRLHDLVRMFTDDPEPAYEVIDWLDNEAEAHALAEYAQRKSITDQIEALKNHDEMIRWDSAERMSDMYEGYLR